MLAYGYHRPSMGTAEHKDLVLLWGYCTSSIPCIHGHRCRCCLCSWDVYPLVFVCCLAGLWDWQRNKKPSQTTISKIWGLTGHQFTLSLMYLARIIDELGCWFSHSQNRTILAQEGKVSTGLSKPSVLQIKINACSYTPSYSNTKRKTGSDSAKKHSTIQKINVGA